MSDLTNFIRGERNLTLAEAGSMEVPHQDSGDHNNEGLDQTHKSGHICFCKRVKYGGGQDLFSMYMIK